jgi:polyisoprenoid-binding protein YceI
MRRIAIWCALLVATAATAANVLPQYVADPARSTLAFEFVQAGAQSRGVFGKFSTTLLFDEKRPTASGLAVTVQIASVDTKDKDRDSTLQSADLFNSAKFPTATFVAQSLAKRADGGLEAVGKLTIRGVARDWRLPLTLKRGTEGGRPVIDLTGTTTLKRLQFGVGQGEWQSTEWVPDEVKVVYNVRLLGKSAAG